MKLLVCEPGFSPLLGDAEYPAGGWVVQLKVMMTALRDAGHKSGVLSYKGANASVGSQSVCDLVETYDPDKGIPKLRTVYYTVPSLISATRAYAPDIILQSCTGMNTGLMAFVARLLRKPFVYRVAGDSDTDGRSDRYLDIAQRFSYRYGMNAADLIICQNAYQQDQLRRRFPGKPLLRLDNAIEMPFARSLVLPRSGRGYVAWTGTFRKVKNLPLLLEMARRLGDIEFRVAGMAAGSDPEIEAALAALAAMPNVRLMGYLKRSEIFGFLSQAVAVLCTSHHEGFPNVFLEGLATGTPVITRQGVDPNGMIAGNNLGFVGQGDDHLAQCIRAAWELPADAYAALSARCRDYVEAHHAPAAMAEKLIAGLSPLVPLRTAS